MARAFGADEAQASHIPAAARAAALKWTPPGFRPFDAGEADAVTADTAGANPTEPDSEAAPAGTRQNGDAAGAAPANGGGTGEAPHAGAANGEDVHSPDTPATEVPEFLRVSP